MSSSLPDRTLARHLDKLEDVRPAMAKVDLKKIDVAWREQIGHAIQRAFSLAGLTQKEAAAALDRDQAQVARWVSGAERPQVDALFAVESLRQPLLVALAELAGDGVTVNTVIKIRRRA